MLLTSGGIKNHAIAKALAHLVGKDLQEASMLFVPTAANTDDGDKSWLVQNIVEFQQCEFKSIDMVDIAGVAPEVWKKRFENVDIICFGGGNEKYLAKIFEELGMKEFLATLPENKVYMGVSAGSMVTGHFMTDELYNLTDKIGKMLNGLITYLNNTDIKGERFKNRVNESTVLYGNKIDDNLAEIISNYYSLQALSPDDSQL